MTDEDRQKNREQCRSYYQKNKEAAKRRAARWVAANPERHRQIAAESAKKTRKPSDEKNRQRVRAWIEENTERNRAKTRAWAVNNPDKVRAKNAKRRAMIFAVTVENVDPWSSSTKAVGCALSVVL